MNTGELKLTCLDLIGEENYDRFSAAEILRWLNRGLEDIAIKTGYGTSLYLLTTVVGVREYDYPANAKNIIRLEYNDEWLPSINIIGLDESSDNSGIPWLTATGAPKNWYPSFARKYGIYPTPEGAYAINVYHFSKGAVLVDDADEPLIPVYFHIAPALYAAYQIKRADNDLTTYGSLRSEYEGPSGKRGKGGLIWEMKKEAKKAKYKGQGQTIKLAAWSS